MAVSDYFTTVQKLYIAFYQRPADSGGLLYWAQRLEAAGGSLEGIIDAFATSAEATALYGPINNDTIGDVIDAIYQALFNRAPDAGGKQFYVQGFQDGIFTPGKIAMDVLNGAQNDDLVAVNNKVLVANRFTESVDGRSMTDPNFGAGTSFNATYSGDTDAEAARTFLAGVTASPTTIKSATEVATYVQSSIADPTDPIMSVPSSGQTFTLTSGADYADTTTAFLNGGAVTSTFKFTSGNEQVNAAGGTFTAADILVDGSTTDNDVLNATLTGSTPIAANLTNIETLKLNIAGAGAGLDFAAITGAKTVEISGTQNAVLSNVAATAPEVTLTGGYDKTLTVAFDTLAGTSTSNPETLKVNLNGAGAKAAVQINIEGTANTGSLEQLTINSAGTAANTLTVGTTDADTGSTYASANGISKFTVTGSQDLTLKVDHATISTKTLENTGTGALTLDIDRGTATTQVTSLAQAAGYSNLVLRGTGDVNVSGIANGATVTLVDSFTGTDSDSLSVKGAATGTNDSLTLVLDHKTDATNLTFNAAFAVNDIETLSIQSKGGDSTGHQLGDASSGFEANAAKTLNISGDTKLTLNLDTDTKFETLNIEGTGKHSIDFVGTSTVTYASGKNVTVNSTSTSNLTLDLSQIQLDTGVSTVETLSVTTGSGADAITLGSFAGAKLVLNAGDGGDSTTAQTITVGDFGGTGTASSDAYTSASTITTGSGKDAITVGNVQATTQVKASLAIDAGDGDNTIVVKGDGTATANISGDISITTGSGKDTIVFGASSTESGGATSLESSSAKVTITTGAGDDTVKLGNVTKSGSTIDLGDGADKVYVGVTATGTSAITNDVVITTGAGSDTIYLYAPDAATGTGQAQKIVITDFTAGTGGDVLNLTGWVGTGFATSVHKGTTATDFNADMATGTGLKVYLLGAFDAADIAAATHATTATSGKVFDLGTSVASDAGKALAVLFNNNTGLTEVWVAYDTDTTTTAASNTDIVIEKIATLENITLTGIADLKIENFNFA